MSGSQPGNWKNRMLVMCVHEAFIVYIFAKVEKKRCISLQVQPLLAGRDVFSPAKPSSLTSRYKKRLLYSHAKNFAVVD